MREHEPRRHVLSVVLATTAFGCDPSPTPQDGARGNYEVITMPATPPGLSDLTVDDQGTLWAIAERERLLVEITLGPHAAATRTVPLEGVPDGVDTEGLVWLGAHTFAISTEGKGTPTAGLLWIETRGDRAVVTRSRTFTSDEIGVPLTNNHGAEAVCGTDGDLLVGFEPVGVLGNGTRYAPIARLRGDVATIVKLRLTSAAGKLSALACRVDDSGDVHGWAIERDFGVSRILTFDLPRAATEITPTIALDLSAALHGTLNLEGVVALPDGRVVLVNDNQSAHVEAPSELLVFRNLTR